MNTVPKKMKVAVITTHMWPAKGYGGVAASTSRLVSSWLRLHKKVLVCTSDGSEGSSLNVDDLVKKYPGASVRVYHTLWFRRWGFGWAAPWVIWKTCREADVIYVNGIATWPCTLGAICCVLMRKPFVVSMRGGLMHNHVQFIKKKKPHKWLYYRLLTLPTISKARAIHVTSERESEGVLSMMPKAQTHVIPNGVSIPNQQYGIPGGKRLRLCYIGRISREKGINAFSLAWLTVRRSGEELLIAGTGKGAYFDEFCEIVLRSQGAIRYAGELEQTVVQTEIAQSHFLVLPSGLEGGWEWENFGNVIAETLAVGRPVMVRRGLAWDYLENLGLNIGFERSTESIERAINKARITVGTEQYKHICTRAREHAERHLSIEKSASELYELCETVAGFR